MKKTILAVLMLLIIFPLISAYDLEDFRKNEKEELKKVFEDERVIDNFLEYTNKPRELKTKKEKKELGFTRDIDYDMVIITNDNLFNIFSDFADIKNEEGIYTQVVSTSTIGTAPATIRTWLTSQKQSNPDLTYLLIGGDASVVQPGAFNYRDTLAYPTDLYYSNVLSDWNDDLSEMETEDFEPDLYVGRIPVNSTAEANNFITTYENYKDNTDIADNWRFLANNIDRYPDDLSGDVIIDGVLDHVTEDITTNVTYEDDIPNLWHENLGYTWPDSLPDPIPDSLLAGVDEYDRPLGAGQFMGDVLDEGTYSFIFTATHGSPETISAFNIDACWGDYNGYVNDGNSMHMTINYNNYQEEYNHCYLHYEIDDNNTHPYVFWLSACSAGRIYSFQSEPILDWVGPFDCFAQQMYNSQNGPVSIYVSSQHEYPFISKYTVMEYMDIQFIDDEHKLGYITRHAWDYYEQFMQFSILRKLVTSHILFGDPSMDVWSGAADEFVIDAQNNTIAAMNSEGEFENDVIICVLDDNGNLLGRGTAPYNYGTTIEDNWIITANKANFKQYKDTYLNSMVPVPQSVGIVEDNGNIEINWDDVDFATGYRIESTNNHYSGYANDTSGSFDGSSWSAAVNGDKRFYRVITQRLLESAPSDTVGYVLYECYPTAGTNLNFIAYPLGAKYDTAGELGDFIGDCDVVNRWIVESQGWDGAFKFGSTWLNDFDLVSGYPYLISVSDTVDVYITGSLPAPPVFNLETTEGTDLNTIMVPLNSNFSFAGDLGDDIGVCDVVYRWIVDGQNWDGAINLGFMWLNNFSIGIGDPLMISVSDDVVWPSTRIVIKK